MLADTATLLYGLVGMLLGVLGAIIAIGRMFVSRSSCDQYHQHMNELRSRELIQDTEWRNSLHLQLAGINRKIDIQFRMLRSILTFMDIPPETKEKILNEGRDM